MKVRIDKDERYPVFSVVKDDASFGETVDVDPAIVRRWRRAEKAFSAAQVEMAEAWNEANS